MPKYCKKPIEIEARRVPAPIDYYHEHEYRAAVADLAAWCGGSVVAGMWNRAAAMSAREIEIVTLEGTMTALPGEYVIRGVAGEFYPCKPEIFAATYDEVHAR